MYESSLDIIEAHFSRIAFAVEVRMDEVGIPNVKNNSIQDEKSVEVGICVMVH